MFDLPRFSMRRSRVMRMPAWPRCMRSPCCRNRSLLLSCLPAVDDLRRLPRASIAIGGVKPEPTQALPRPAGTAVNPDGGAAAPAGLTAVRKAASPCRARPACKITGPGRHPALNQCAIPSRRTVADAGAVALLVRTQQPGGRHADPHHHEPFFPASPMAGAERGGAARRCRDRRDPRPRTRRRVRLGEHRAAAAAGLRAAADPGTGLHLDARLLGLGALWLLLGAGHLGTGAVRRRAVDAGLLGLERRRLHLPSRLLGTPRGLLRRHQLRLRLRRPWL